MVKRSGLTRKEFVQGMGLALGGLLAAPFLTAAGKPPPNMLLYQSRSSIQPASVALYRGTPDGKVLKSEDGGGTWHVLVNFGADYVVETVSQTAKGLLARLSYAGAGFSLLTQDERIWRTTNAVEKRLYMPLVVR